MNPENPLYCQERHHNTIDGCYALYGHRGPHWSYGDRLVEKDPLYGEEDFWEWPNKADRHSPSSADKLRAIKALHIQTCEINGANSSCDPESCVVQVCGPCGESWPCETVRIIEE